MTHAEGTPDDRAALIEILAPLSDGLYRALDQSLELAEGHFAEYDMTSVEYRSGLHHLARAHARRLLALAAQADEISPWELAAPRPNLQITLRHENVTLRLLRPIGRVVPPPGPNLARRAYYANVHDNLLGIHGSNLLGLWSIDSETDEIQLRIVRPVGTWRYGNNARIDIDLLLPRDADDLAGLEFVPQDDLQVALPFEDDGEEAGQADGNDL